MPQLPLNPDLRPPYRRRLLLRIGQEAGWWDYESENDPGHVAGGVTYDQASYTIRHTGQRVTLTVAEVDRLLTLDDPDALRAEVARLVAERSE